MTLLAEYPCSLGISHDHLLSFGIGIEGYGTLIEIDHTHDTLELPGVGKQFQKAVVATQYAGLVKAVPGPAR